MRRVIGWFLIAIPFISLFLLFATYAGLMLALIVFGVIAAQALLLSFGISLVVD